MGQLRPRASGGRAAGVDASGKLLAFEYTAWGHTGRRGIRRCSWPSAAAPPGHSARRRLQRAVSRRTCRRWTCTTFPNRLILNHRVLGGGYLRTGPSARTYGSVGVLRAGRDDGRARARGPARSLRVSQTEYLASALARRAQGGDRCRQVDPTRRGVQPLLRHGLSAGEALGSARTTCRSTRVIASPMPRRSWTSR